MEKRANSVTMSRLAINCQREKREGHISEFVSSHGAEVWQRSARSSVEVIHHRTLRAMVDQMAMLWPLPGVKRRKRKAVEHLVRNRVRR